MVTFESPYLLLIWQVTLFELLLCPSMESLVDLTVPKCLAAHDNHLQCILTS